MNYDEYIEEARKYSSDEGSCSCIPSEQGYIFEIIEGEFEDKVFPDQAVITTKNANNKG